MNKLCKDTLLLVKLEDVRMRVVYHELRGKLSVYIFK